MLHAHVSCAGVVSVEEIYQRLEKGCQDAAWAEKQAKTMSSMSPTSLKVGVLASDQKSRACCMLHMEHQMHAVCTHLQLQQVVHRQVREGASKDIAECFKMEKVSAQER